MSNHLIRVMPSMCVAGVGLMLLSACGAGITALPETVSVTLPDNTVVEVTEGSGAPSLANSKWQFIRTAGNAQGAVFAVIRFGPNGELEAFENNTLASNIFGEEIIFDSSRRETKQFGLSYAAATYGAETNDSSGFTFEGRFTAFAGGLVAGEATASATAEYDGDDKSVVVGKFSFSSQVTLIEMPEAEVEDEFNFMGIRVEE